MPGRPSRLADEPKLPGPSRVWNPMRRLSTPLLTAFFALALAPAALAERPGNDLPVSAAPLEPYTAQSGVPGGRQGFAELAEATPDAGVPRCLGSGSFERTVWFRVPATPVPRELSIDAAGETTDGVDLAAFVQTSATPLLSRPNACAGAGLGAADAAEDPATEITVRLPAWRGLLVQVARRGPAGSAADERALLTVAESPLDLISTPPGDRIGLAVPTLPRKGSARVLLGGASTTEDEPAQPACPSMGSVWRRVRPTKGGRRIVSASGRRVATLSVYRGVKPTPKSELACVDREGDGPLTLPVKVKPRKLLWVRIGTDRPDDTSRAALSVRAPRPGEGRSGGGCLSKLRTSASVALAQTLPLKKRNRMGGVAVSVRVSRGPVCHAELELVGPRDRVYATRKVAVLRGGGEVVGLGRLRRLVPGRYRVRIEGAGLAGNRKDVPTKSDLRIAR
jgi:hypothetical protein